ncbi:branched-chain amino acid ABC transporter permease [Shinella daejeonensis]|uniref:branched-chain amino acid ABC transporter permease n=1 Tax=Shinella daejeonensis TaxID=659017 RepID=UPI0020C801E3|nr:branched-chain amino acid ABC transporter permease [Shinella daejeonensis]MCP8894741.1 branched-chain amino acid ABC transporter permease [Shinella daejeonensis]
MRFYLLATMLAALIGVASVALGEYWLNVVVIFLINVMMLIGFRLVTLMGGWSFAHVAFMGLGAYTTAILTTMDAPWSFWVTIPLAVLISGAVAFLVGLAVLRTRHYYFFLSSLAAGEALRQCFAQLDWITGGTYGISFIPRPSPVFGLVFNDTRNFLWLVLAFVLAVAFFARWFDSSEAGRRIRAIAINEDLSASIGINTWAHRVLAFVVGSAVAGIAGVFFASFNKIVNPLDFSSVYMFRIVAAAIVGGVTTFFGPLLGLLYLTAVEELFRGIPEYVPLIWGFSVIGVLLLLPGGLETVFTGEWSAGMRSRFARLFRMTRGAHDAGR